MTSGAESATPVLMTIKGKHLIVFSEIGQKEVLNIQVLKRLLGAENILGRKLHRDSEQFGPICGYVLLCNILPGSYINSNFELEPGLFIEKINDQKICNYKSFKDILLFNFQKDKFIKFTFDEDQKIVIFNLDKVLEEHENLSKKYNFKTSNFMNKLKLIKNKKIDLDYQINYSQNINFLNI